MFKNLSLRIKLQLLSFFSILAVSLIIAIISIMAIQHLSHENIESFKHDAYMKKEEELKNYVSLAVKTIETYYQRTHKDRVKAEVQGYLEEQTNFLFSILQGEYDRLKATHSLKEIEHILSSIVKKTRYGKSGYFWINDMSAKIIMHPIKPSLNGRDLMNFTDKNGKKIFKAFVQAAKTKEKSGFVDYVWPKPGFETPQDKVSYVKLFTPLNWVIGTGEYVDNVTAALKKEALSTISKERYGKDGYFWINSTKPAMIMHPIKPSLDGKDLSQVQDKAGKFLFNDMVKVATAKEEGGLVKYMWPKPGFEEAQEKFSYVIHFKEWDWIVGTGAYIDDIDKEIAIMENSTTEEIDSVVMKIIIFALIAMTIISLGGAIFIRKAIVNPILTMKDAIYVLVNDNNNKKNEIEKISNDEVGELVDAFNAYLTKLKDIAAQDTVVIEEVEKVIRRVNNGFYVYKVHSQSQNQQVQELKESINSMIEQTNVKLQEINKTLLEYGNSNFDYSTDIKGNASNGIIGSITNSTAILGGAVSEILSMITESGNRLNHNAKVLSQSVDTLATSANEQAASLEETAAAIEEITSLIQSSTQNIGKMSVLANELNDSASQGESLATRTTSAMEEIDTQVNSISEAITVIDQIAFQTNILSLNAAVEAATAGEAGKGFAVVAQEVRNLASRSADAAKEIKDLVEQATAKANEGKSIADEMIDGYSKLNEKIGETIGLISDVASSSKEQEAGIVQINDAINSLDQGTQVNACSATQINTLSSEVLDLSNDLLAIAQRAKYNTAKSQQICDVDLVFKTAKLKNDHIIFKNTNFAKVGANDNKRWTVTKETECDLGNWIITQERESRDFTRTSNWKMLNENHVRVHQMVQSYIDENAKEIPNEELLFSTSTELELATSHVFEALDQLKIEHCQMEGKKETKKQENEPLKTAVTKEEFAQQSQEEIELFDDSLDESLHKDDKAKDSGKVITPNNSDEDEWESF